MFYVNIDGVFHPSDNLPPNSNNKATIDRRERRKRSKMGSFSLNGLVCKTNTFVDCPKAQPYVATGICIPKTACVKEEGKTPMRYNDNYASASAIVSTAKSDMATSRDYFLNRLAAAEYPKDAELVKMFNLNVDNSPKNYKQLIDAIKGGKYTINKQVEKAFEASEEDGKDIYWGATHGIIWDGPQADYEGYEKASEEKSKQETIARDAIMAAATAGDMKAAVEAFEAWMPTTAAQ